MARSLVVALAALIFTAGASAKELRTMVIVGADGRSAVIRPAAYGVLDRLLNFGRGSNRPEPPRTRPRGPYVLLYPLAYRGLPAIPGRFYPRARAACFSWDTEQVGRPCHVVDRAQLNALAPSRRLPPLLGRPTHLAELTRPDGAALFPGSEPLAWANATVAVEMAFGRWRSGRPLVDRPRDCIALRGRWSGPERGRRPAQLCLAKSGAWTHGRLYPLGRGVWEFVRAHAH